MLRTATTLPVKSLKHATTWPTWQTASLPGSTPKTSRNSRGTQPRLQTPKGEDHMRNDSITGQLNAAIEEADRLNRQAEELLEKAFMAAMNAEDANGGLSDNARFKTVKAMRNASLRLHNI